MKYLSTTMFLVLCTFFLGAQADLSEIKNPSLLQRTIPTTGVTTAVFSWDGQQLITGTKDQKLRLWDSHTGKLLKTLEGHTSPIKDIQWLKNEHFVASAADDKVIIWDLMTAKPAVTIANDANISALSLDPSGLLMVSLDENNAIKLWDVATGKFITQVQDEDLKAQVKTITFNPDGRQLASYDETAKLHLWEIPSIERRLELMTNPILEEWMVKGEQEKKKAYNERIKTKYKQRMLIANDLAQQFITNYRKTVPWETDITMGKYNSEEKIFKIHSKVFGHLKMKVAPNDAEKVKNKKARMEIREMEMSYVGGDLVLSQMTVYFRGLNRRYEVTR